MHFVLAFVIVLHQFIIGYRLPSAHRCRVTIIHDVDSEKNDARTNEMMNTNEIGNYGSSIMRSFHPTTDGLNIEVLVSLASVTESRYKVSNSKVEEPTSSWLKYLNPSNTVSILKSFSQTTILPRKVSPLIFIHGSFHSAWCFTENYFNFFNALGYDCFSISLRGTDSTGFPETSPTTTVRLDEHVSDVSGFIFSLVNEYSAQKLLPVLIAHSFGGLIVMKLLEDERIRRSVAGVALLCSVPPSGNAAMTRRFITRDPCVALKIVMGIALKFVTRSETLCNEIFFNSNANVEDIRRYMRNFELDSQASLDIPSFLANLPSRVSMDDGSRASWLRSFEKQIGLDAFNASSSSDGSSGSDGIDGSNLVERREDGPLRSQSTVQWIGEYLYNVSDWVVSTTNGFAKDTIKRLSQSSWGRKGDDSLIHDTIHSEREFPRLVVGAERDYIVDLEGVLETAKYFGVPDERLRATEAMYSRKSSGKEHEVVSIQNNSSTNDSLADVNIVEDGYHDVMLGPRWKDTAEVLSKWLELHEL